MAQVNPIRLVNPGSETRNIFLPDPASHAGSIKIELRFDRPCSIYGPALLAELSRKGAFAIFDVVDGRWRVNLDHSHNAVVDGWARGGFIYDIPKPPKQFVGEFADGTYLQFVHTKSDLQREAEDAEFVDLTPETLRLT